MAVMSKTIINIVCRFWYGHKFLISLCKYQGAKLLDCDVAGENGALVLSQDIFGDPQARMRSGVRFGRE